MMPLTLSLRLVLADADATIVAGVASAMPAANAPMTLSFTIPPGIASTAYTRGAAHPSRQRKVRAWIRACRGYEPLARVGVPRGAVVSRNGGPACATRDYQPGASA